MFSSEPIFITQGGLPSWLPTVGGAAPLLFADFAASNYWYGGATYGSFASWLAASSGSFSRLSSATFVNSSGLLASDANNVPRFSYNPLTLAPVGLLLEYTSTNQLINSNNFTNWLAISSATRTQNVTGPDGVASSAWTFSPTTATGELYLVTSASVQAFSLYVKAGSGGLFPFLVLEGGGNYAFAVFDPVNSATATQTGGSSWVVAATSVINVGNGWYQVSMILSVPETVINPCFSLAQAATGTTVTSSGDITNAASSNSMQVYGAQMENFPVATSYVATTTATLARASDLLTWPPATVSAANGTAFIRWSASPLFSNDHLMGGTNANKPFFYRNTTNGIAMYDGASLAATPNLTGTNDRAASTWDNANNRKAITSNGAAANDGTINLGFNYVADGSSLQLGGDTISTVNAATFAQVALWTVTATDAQLQALTT